MKLKLHKLLNILISFSLFVNSIYMPIVVYAQEISPSPTPTSIIEETQILEPTASPTPSEEPVVTSPIPSEEPTVSPEPTNEVLESLEPEAQDSGENVSSQESQDQGVESSPTVTLVLPLENGSIQAIILDNTQASSIDEYDLDYQDAGSATIQTDKLDYAPTDTVLITGSGFLPNTEYSIEITSDTGNFKFADRVSSDEAGGLFFSYQLDGTYRPNYLVEVERSNKLIAVTTFTDGPVVPIIEYNNFEGEIAPQGSNNWTNGNISGYKEGDTIRFRADVTSTGTGTGSIFVGFTSDSACRFFAYELPTNVSITGSGFSVTAPTSLIQDGDDAIAEFIINSTSATNGKLNFTLHVSDNAAACASGSSQHVQVDHATGDVKDSGAKALPIPASAVAPVTDITILKSGPVSSAISSSFSYNISVNNLDLTTAESVVVLDTLPLGITYVSSSWTKTNPSATGSCSAVGQLITCNLGNISGNASVTITINVTVDNNSQYCGTSLRNVSTVSTTTLESNIQNNSSQTDTAIDQCSAHLIVIKHVINDNGGTNSAADFTMTINNLSAEGGNSFAGVESPGIDKKLLTVGSYSVSESGPSGYSASYSTDCSGTINLNETKTCTITNDDIQPKLTVTKIVSGSDEPVSNFNLFVDSISVVSGVQNGFDAGSYVVSETPNNDYIASISGDCFKDGSVILSVGDVKSCTITNTRKQGSITFIKSINVGDESPSSWTFDVYKGTTKIGTYNHNETVTLDTGSYTVIENGPSSYFLDSIGGTACSESILAGIANLSVTEDGGTCQFGNSEKATITINKFVNPANSDTFDFTVSTNPAGYLGTTTLGNDGSHTFTDLMPGSYNIIESINNDYTTLVMCNGVLGGPTSFMTTLKAGDDLVCNFTNTKKGQIIVEKQTLPDGHAQTFNFTGEVSGTISDGEQLNKTVVPGTYYVSENPYSTSGYRLTGISCDDRNSSGDIQTGIVTFNVEAGETIKCTFTNEIFGSIKVHKYEDSNMDGDQDSDESNLSGWTMSLYNGSNCQEGNFYRNADTEGVNGEYVFYSIIPGQYSVKETLEDGWSNVTNICQNIYVNPSEQGVVNFGNVELGSISGQKFEDINGNGIKDAGEPGLQGWSIGLRTDLVGHGSGSMPTLSDGSYSFTGLIPGDYYVCEYSWPSTLESWHQTYPNSGPTYNGNYCHLETVESGEDIENIDFGNFEYGQLTACKFNDLNGNGQFEEQDSPISGIDIILSKFESAAWNPLQTLSTGEKGCVTYTDLDYGNYKVEEDLNDPDLAGFYSTNGITSYDDILVTSGYDNSDTPFKFLNTQYRSISGKKYNDLNGNGQIDPGEPGLKNWRIFIDDGDGIKEAGEVTAITDDNGDYSFTGLVSDSYIIREVLKSGWTQTEPLSGYWEVDVHEQVSSTDNNFGNFKLGIIQGRKYEDLNANGLHELNDGEERLDGWTVRLYKPGEIWEYTDQEVITGHTGSPGQYEFNGLTVGTYYVCEVLEDGWTQTGPTEGSVSVDSDGNPISNGIAVSNQSGRQDEASVCWQTEITSGSINGWLKFGNFESGTVTACKYEDLDGDGQKDENENPISGVTIDLYKWFESTPAFRGILELSEGVWGKENSGQTQEDGCIVFGGLEHGLYRVMEDTSSLNGYYQTLPESNNYEFEVESGYDNSQNPFIFLNAPYGKVTIKKITDPSRSEKQFEFELGDGELTKSINLYDGQEESFDWNLIKGDYSVTEIVPEGWQLTNVICTGEDEFENGDYVNVDPGEEVICTFTNAEEQPSLSIEKTNDKPNASSGDIVNYTLKVTNTGNIKIGNIEVIDVLPGGFEYVLNSAKVDGIYNEPNINNNVLTWAGIDLGVKEDIEINYQVKVGSGLKAGIYTNLATCKTGKRESNLLFVAQISDVIYDSGICECNNGNPVSSTVSLGQSYDYSGNLTPQVLGLSTELPATGSQTWILIISGLLGIFGVGLKVWEKKTKNENN